MERVTPERDLCEVLLEAGWLDPELVAQVRHETLREEPDRSPTLPDRPPDSERHETEPLEVPFGVRREVDPPRAPAQDLSGWPEEDPAEAAPPERLILGPYRVLQKLGQGGMGMVFMAEHSVLKRQVALKLIRPREGADRGRALRRFEIEARAMARLEHPNILKVLDIRVEAAQAYMVMDLARGGTLSERIHDPQRLADPEQVVAWIEGLARALHHAHEHAIVHRDVKPDNILFDEAGRPLLTDFGLAKALDEESAGVSTPGAMIGTLLYMSPEQIHGRQVVDARADIYALGATFHEALTGAPPFMATTAADLIDQVLSQRVPSLRKRRPELPLDLETIVARCLAKDRDERYPSALALAEDCRRYLERRPILARPSSVPERLRLWLRRNPVGILGSLAALALLLVGAAAYDATRQRGRAQSALESAQAAQAANLALEAQEARARDAEARALAAKREAQTSLAQATQLQAALAAQAGRRRRAVELYGEAARLQRDLGGDPFPAEAGRWDLWRRAPQALLPYPGPDPPRRLAIRADRVWIARGNALEVWDAARATLLERLEIPKGESLACLSLSPDGKRGLGGGSQGSLWLWTLGTPAPQVLTRSESGLRAVALRGRGDFALSVDTDDLVRLRQLASKVELLIPIEGRVQALCFVPGTKRFLIGLLNEVQIWDAAALRRLATLPVPGEHLSAHAKLALAGGAGVVHLLDPLARVTRHRFDLDPAPLRALALGPEGGLALDGEGQAFQLDVGALSVRRRWELVTDKVALAACDADARRLVTSEPESEDPSRLERAAPPRLWRLRDSRHQRAWRAPRRQRTSLTLTPEGLVVSGTAAGVLEIWDPDLELRVGRWRQPAQIMSLAARGEHVASGGEDGLVRLWRLGAEAPTLTLGPHLGPVQALAFSPGGQRLLAGGEGIPAWGLDLPPDDPARRLLEGYPVGPQRALSLDPSGRLLVEGPTPARFQVQPLRLWSLHQAKLLQSYTTGRVTALSWNERQPVSGGQAGWVRAWSAEQATPTWEQALPPPGEEVRPAVEDLLLSSRGWVLAAGPTLWLRGEGGALQRLEPPEDPLGGALTLAPGPWPDAVWSGHVGGSVALWDLRQGRALLVARGHEDQVSALQTLPDGRLLSVGLDGRVLVRDFAQGPERVAVEEELARAARQRTRDGRAAPWPRALIARLAAAQGAWDLLEPREQRETGARADRLAAARAQGAWSELQVLVPRAPGVRGQLQAAALALELRVERCLGEARALLVAGRGEESQLRRLFQELSQLAVDAPGDERIHLQLGRLAEATRQEAVAARSYETALEIAPELAPEPLTPGFLVTRGRLHLEAGREGAALIDYARLGQSRHRVAGRPSRDYAQLLLQLGDPEQALDALGEDASEADRRLRSEILLRLGRPQEALAALAKDDSPQAALARARVLRELGDLAEAERLLRAILELDLEIEAQLVSPHALRFYEGDLERYVREPDFVSVSVGFSPRHLGARELHVTFKVTARRSLEVVERDLRAHRERRPDLLALEAHLELARVHCRASRRNAKQRAKLLRAAVKEIRAAAAGGLRDFEALHNDPDLALVRNHKSYQALIRRER